MNTRTTCTCRLDQRRRLPRRIRDNHDECEHIPARTRWTSGMALVRVVGLICCAAIWLPSTVCAVPTDAPTVVPSASTAFPSLSAVPTPSEGGSNGSPSSILSYVPSDMPSLLPSTMPSYEETINATARFRQDFSVENGRLFTVFEQTLIQGLYASYTEAFTPSDVRTGEGQIVTVCEFLFQVPMDQAPVPAPSRRMSHTRARNLQATLSYIQVDFNMKYESNTTNVSTFPLLFQSYVNTELGNVARQMRILGLNVSEAFLASRIIIRPEPTVSPSATSNPSDLLPSALPTPSAIISIVPTLSPTAAPALPTPSPTARPMEPPPQPPSGGAGGSGKTVIAVSVVVAVLIVVVGLLLYYQKRKHVRELADQRNTLGAMQMNQQNDSDGIGQKTEDDGKDDIIEFISATNANSTLAGDFPVATTGVPDAVLGPSDSYLSNRSLLSTGNSIAGDSNEEVDATHNLADEFDEYKDQNLEKMRAGVESNLTGFDGIMSQALTRALIDEDETNVDPTELLWGGSGNLIGIEIEASALGEVTDWLKRQGSPSDIDRRLFVQEMLNKMVASVRHGVLGPEEASRSIHECAALLGLQLATEIPGTTLIITGMRKTVIAEDMIAAFSEFGEISEAAVASNQRGFGILRFLSNKSVDIAMERFRTEEIVVQDVAVQVKVLRPGSNSLSEDEDLLLSGGPGILPP